MTRSPTEGERRFASRLADLASADNPNRGALAAFRRGLGKKPGEAPEMFPYIVPLLPADVSGWNEETYYLVASLFALHQGTWHGGPNSYTDLGASMRRLQQKVDTDSTAARFVALLNSRREDAGDHLRSIIGLLGSNDIPVDWALLLHDLKQWEWDSRVVQRAWARSFWGSYEPEQPEATVASDAAMAEAPISQ